MSIADLYFVRGTEAPRLCLAVNLADADLSLMVAALRQHFDAIAGGAVEFYAKRQHEYSALERIDRMARTEWDDSGIATLGTSKAIEYLLAIGNDLSILQHDGMSDDSRRWFTVRIAAMTLVKEIAELKHKLGDLWLTDAAPRDEILARLKGKLAGSPSQLWRSKPTGGADDEPRFTVADVGKLVFASNPVIRNHAKKAGLPLPGVGQHTHKWTESQFIKLLESIASTAYKESHRQLAKVAIEKFRARL